MNPLRWSREHPVVASVLGFYLLALAVTVSPSKAQNREYTGNDWLEKCSADASKSESLANKADSWTNLGMCYGYLIAISDIVSIIPESLRYCLAQGVTMDQVRQVTLKYLRENPGKTHEPFVSLVLDALREAFPCKPGQ